MHAIDGIDRIEELVKLGFEVTVGSGVMPNQMAQWQAVGVEHFHASCRSSEKVELPIFDGTVNRVSSERVRSWLNRGIEHGARILQHACETIHCTMFVGGVCRNAGM